MENIQVKVIPVIEVTYSTGDGTEKDPCREVFEYHLIDGTLVGKTDPFMLSE